jgi:HAD superfamily hydrolase (TIGR01509 family)
VPSATSGLRAVVFDLDGVLVDSEHLWEEMWARYADRHGATWTAEHTAAVQGMSAPEWAAYVAKVAGGGEPAERTETAVVDDMVAALEAGRSPLLPGARAMVRDVSARVPIALASSAPRRLIDAVLDTHDLVGDFTATVSSAEVPRGKPSPDVYLEAARRLGTPASHCAGVEDSSNGIRAVHAAGMTVIALPNPTYPPKPDALALADEVAADLDDVRTRLLARVATSTAAKDRS